MKPKVDMPFVQVDFKQLSEGGERGRCTNLTRKSSPISEGITSKTMTQLFDRFMKGRVKLWNDKEGTSILPALCANMAHIW